MHTFRFNPQAERWVMLGGPLEHAFHMSAAHELEIGRTQKFAAATHPKHPFSLEINVPLPSNSHLLYAEQPPVGEYEFILYREFEDIFTWDSRLWEEWLTLVQHRLLQFHRNPYLHHARVVLFTSLQQSTSPHRRVGDLIATSHPVTGSLAPMAIELADRLREREPLFVIHHDRHGSLYVPSAPTHDDEVWYLPQHPQPHFESVHGGERTGAAEAISLLFRAMRAAHLQHDYVLEIHTAFADGQSGQSTWWLQCYRQHLAEDTPVPIQRLPETLVQQLRYAMDSLGR